MSGKTARKARLAGPAGNVVSAPGNIVALRTGNRIDRTGRKTGFVDTGRARSFGEIFNRQPHVFCRQKGRAEPGPGAVAVMGQNAKRAWREPARLQRPLLKRMIRRAVERKNDPTIRNHGRPRQGLRRVNRSSGSEVPSPNSGDSAKIGQIPGPVLPTRSSDRAGIPGAISGTASPCAGENPPSSKKPSPRHRSATPARKALSVVRLVISGRNPAFSGGRQYGTSGHSPRVGNAHLAVPISRGACPK